MSESDVQLQTEGSGPLIRTLTVTTVIDGVATDVQMQVIAISDPDGKLLVGNFSWQEQVLTALHTIHEDLILINERLE